MELGKQIKRYRSEFGFSQEALAEKVYVSRQTISNWENDKNYPDINSLLRLSEVFHVSIDILIKGDVEKMKKEIQMNKEIREEDRKRFERDSYIYTALLAATLLTPIPLLHFLDNAGIGIWVILTAIAGWFAFRVEKEKKMLDIQTYKEILAFTEGKSLNEIQKAQEEGKRPYQRVFYAVGAALTALAVSAVMMWIFK